MYFSINAYKTENILDMRETYRLKQNGEWVSQEDYRVFNLENDKLFSSHINATHFIDFIKNAIIDGETVPINDEMGNFFKRKYHFEVIAHRVYKPKNPIFSKAQILTALISGDDNFNNSLVIDSQGNPKLINLMESTPVSETEYPVRYKTFVAYDENVGVSFNDFHRLDEIYLTLLEGWETHISTGRSIYVDYRNENLSENELVDRINNLISELE